MSLDPLQATASLGEAGTDPRATAEFARALAVAKGERRATVHALHRWYGKLVPAIPATAIALFTEPGDVVVDPFCGSGTTLVEARLAGRAGIGRDVSPLATLLTRVKTSALEPVELAARAARFVARFAADDSDDWMDRIPDMANREHYYPDPVARSLVALYAAARAEEHEASREFLLAVVSAINRTVSNCDPRHVFPGVSKKRRAEIAAGWVADVPGRLRRALKARLASMAEFHASAASAPRALVEEGPAAGLTVPAPGAALVVTNPPYVSSIRYTETFKLEALWVGACLDRAALRDLDRRMLGTERVDVKGPLAEAEASAVPTASCREVVRDLGERGEHVMARVIARYVQGLDAALAALAAGLRPGGHVVVKLAPSRVRGTVVPTPAACVELLAPQGVTLLGAVEDAYSSSSRTLTTARNWYSGRMDSDALLLFRKALT